jgi:hypothetical protein
VDSTSQAKRVALQPADKAPAIRSRRSNDNVRLLARPWPTYDSHTALYDRRNSPVRLIGEYNQPVDRSPVRRPNGTNQISCARQTPAIAVTCILSWDYVGIDGRGAALHPR